MNDIHTLAAAKFYRVEPEAVTPEQRRMIKARNFGLTYGLPKPAEAE